MPQSLRKVVVVWDVNSGPPSEASSLGIPKVPPEYVDQSLCAILCSLHYGPSRVSVDYYQVVAALVAEEVRTDTLEWILG